MSIHSPSPVRTTRHVETKVSQYDIVNGALISTIVILSCFVVMMFLLWLTSGSERVVTLPPMEFPIVTLEEEGDDDDLDDPDDDFPEEDFMDLALALDAIPDAISDVEAALNARASGSEGTGRGRRARRGVRGVPEHQRWVIQYESDSITSYAKQLSFFQIDLGVFYRNSPRIFRLRDPGGSAQVIETSRDEEQKTLRFMHKERRMIRWDEELCRRAGISLEPDGITCQFYPETTRQLLRNIEGQALQAEGKELKNVRTTYFKVEPEGAGFAFRIINIVYR